MKLSRLIMINLSVFVLLVVILEGISSLIFGFWKAFQIVPVAENSHTQYDELLGWVNIPNVYIQDQYGPGIWLKTNSQAFRNDEDFSNVVAKDKQRIICSGDSFTLGYGVNNDQSWCHLLSKMAKNIETVNMGQGGYGVDQAYLWYKRDGSILEHDLQIFAFVTYDFLRMQTDKFISYPKPVLNLPSGAPKNEDLAIENITVPEDVVIENIPVPKVPKHLFEINKIDLRSVHLGRKFLEKISFNTKPASSNNKSDIIQEKTKVIALKIFEDLHQINNRKDSTLVVVYLPTISEYTENEQLKLMRQYLKVELSKRDILFIDLIDEFRKLPNQEVQTLFLNDGHYTVKGNEFVAIALSKKIYPLVFSKNGVAESSYQTMGTATIR